MANHVKHPVVDGKKVCSRCLLEQTTDCFRFHKGIYQSICKTCRAIWTKKYRQLPKVKEHSKKWHAEHNQKPHVKEYRKQIPFHEKQITDTSRYTP